MRLFNEIAKRIQISLDYLEKDRTELDLVYEIMLKYGIDDIRHLYTNDLRFLKQFNKEK